MLVNPTVNVAAAIVVDPTAALFLICDDPLYPVKDHSGLFRDSNTGAIINNNKNDFQKYIENRNRMLNQSEKVEKLEKNLDELKDDINDIKSLLTKFLESNG